MNIAGFYQRQGNFDKMIEAVQERTKQEPNNPEAFYTLATFYWEKASRDVKLSDAQKINYTQAGLDAVNKALELKSDYIEALIYKNLLAADPGQHLQEPGRTAETAEGSRRTPQAGPRNCATSSAPTTRRNSRRGTSPSPPNAKKAAAQKGLRPFLCLGSRSRRCSARRSGPAVA